MKSLPRYEPRTRRNTPKDLPDFASSDREIRLRPSGSATAQLCDFISNGRAEAGHYCIPPGHDCRLTGLLLNLPPAGHFWWRSDTAPTPTSDRSKTSPGYTTRTLLRIDSTLETGSHLVCETIFSCFHRFPSRQFSFEGPILPGVSAIALETSCLFASTSRVLITFAAPKTQKS